MNHLEVDESKIIKVDKPIGWLYHEPTRTCISVYKRITPFQRWMLKLCFGLKYEEDHIK